ncbi:MAG: C40 family peptidase [Acidobacteria bacterium]|nr:C40 family peptidase [Acidobacteriota bacterium]
MILVLLVTGLAGACASSTGAVPRPFPTPRGAGRGATTDADVPRPLPATARPGDAGEKVPDGYALSGTALSLRGVPYVNGGSTPSGFDCSGFVQYVFGQNGLALPREVRDQFRLGRTVDRDRLEAGDLVFFTTIAPGASHVGIALGGDQFVHAPSRAGVVRVEHLSAPYWSARYVAARRID